MYETRDRPRKHIKLLVFYLNHSIVNPVKVYIRSALRITYQVVIFMGITHVRRNTAAVLNSNTHEEVHLF